jgi:hypothetical protein
MFEQPRVCRADAAVWWQHICHTDGIRLAELERQLLGEEDITHGKVPLGPKAKKLDASAILVEPLDVEEIALPDAIAGARVAPYHLEVAKTRIMMTLGRREIAQEEPGRALPSAP